MKWFSKKLFDSCEKLEIEYKKLTDKLTTCESDCPYNRIIKDSFHNFADRDKSNYTDSNGKIVPRLVSVTIKVGSWICGYCDYYHKPIRDSKSREVSHIICGFKNKIKGKVNVRKKTKK